MNMRLRVTIDLFSNSAWNLAEFIKGISKSNWFGDRFEMFIKAWRHQKFLICSKTWQAEREKRTANTDHGLTNRKNLPNCHVPVKGIDVPGLWWIIMARANCAGSGNWSFDFLTLHWKKVIHFNLIKITMLTVDSTADVIVWQSHVELAVSWIDFSHLIGTPPWRTGARNCLSK
jgi:hypothetical protein